MKNKTGERVTKNHKSIWDNLLVGFAIMTVILLTVLFFVMPKKQFSEMENRYLSEFPEFSWKNLWAGEYMDDWSDYLTDHFPMRNFWMSLRSESRIVMGEKEIGGVVLASDGYLIGRYEQPTQTEHIIDVWNRFAQKVREQNPSVDVRLMVVPSAAYIYRDKLPVDCSMVSQKDTLDQITENVDIDCIDVCTVLENAARGNISLEDGSGKTADRKDDSLENISLEVGLYYKTDHHWTTLGAYYGYEAYCEAAGLEPIPLESFSAAVATTDFHGTYSSKVNRPWEEGDTITIYENPDDSLIVEYNDTDQVTDSLYNLEYAEKKDKYSLFLDNLHSLITITNENAATDRELLLVKDSYANSLVPFLASHYAKIYVIDPRYYKQGVSNFLQEQGTITDVLIIYNLSTLDTDTGIAGIY